MSGSLFPSASPSTELHILRVLALIADRHLVLVILLDRPTSRPGQDIARAPDHPHHGNSKHQPE